MQCRILSINQLNKKVFFDEFVTPLMPVKIQGIGLSEVLSPSKILTSSSFSKSFGKSKIRVLDQSHENSVRPYMANLSHIVAGLKTGGAFYSSGSPIDASIGVKEKNRLFGHLASSLSKPRLFMAGPRAAATLHFDGDYRHNLLVQTFGVKKIVMFPPRNDDAMKSCFQTSTLAEKIYLGARSRNFLDQHGGLECILEPGDTLYIPKCWWHAVKYLEPSASLSFRFGGSEDSLFLLSLPSQVLAQLYTYKIPDYTKRKGKENLERLKRLADVQMTVLRFFQGGPTYQKLIDGLLKLLSNHAKDYFLAPELQTIERREKEALRDGKRRLTTDDPILTARPNRFKILGNADRGMRN